MYIYHRFLLISAHVTTNILRTDQQWRKARDEARQCTMSRTLFFIFLLFIPLLVEAQSSSAPKASALDDNCVDLHAPGRVSDCPFRKYLCEDPLYKPLMKVQCPKTCGYCT
uniref:ShKT domain-containing protein n=1 Tax=Steinernema glaseri TaxID=37863 RepID=A0A1I7YWH5_9BILA